MQSWLGDAMEGPTPVSALIHAATMVTAGVYLIVRSGPVFDLAPGAQLGVVIVGAVTLLFGAIVGCAKDDIKKALAASTMSQIGYMVLAAGLGPAGYAVAIMHLLTHGFFKAGLFLGAGSVMHAMDDEVNMRHYGGLRTLLPITFATFGLGYLAIIGVPPFAGFFSKDAIIESALNAGGVKGAVLGGAALLGAGITAFYMTRVMLMTFFGERRWAASASAATGETEATHPHESPRVMTWPMIALAVGSIAAGGLLAIGGTLQHWLEPVVGSHEAHQVLPAWVVTVLALSVVAVGILVAYRMYAQRTVPDTAPDDVSALTMAARRDLYGDAINEELLMKPGQVLTKDLVWFDDKGVDGATGGLAALVGRTSNGLRRSANGLRPLLRIVDARRRGAHRRSDPGGATVVTSIPWLTILWAVPMLGAALVMLVPASGRALAKWFALLVSVVVLVLAVALAVGFDSPRPSVPIRRIPQLDTVFRHRLHPRPRRHRAGARRAHRGAGAAADRGRLERCRRSGRPAGSLHAYLPCADPGRRGHGRHFADLA